MTDSNRGQNAQIRAVEEQVERTEGLAKDGAEAFGRGAQGLGSAVEL